MYKIEDNKIIVSKEDFNIEHILLCGQIFSYEKIEGGYKCFSKDKKAEIFEFENYYEIITNSIEYFVDFFDLETDYTKIKKELLKHKILKKPIDFGFGIRILKNDKFEMLISFIISANNNIKRIQKIINGIKKECGKNMGDYYAFPTRKELLKLSESDFIRLGAGYRAKYLFNVLRQVDEKTLEIWNQLDTKSLRNNLIDLYGVGPKVADCVLLFGYGRQDVFPVDTWIEKVYNQYFGFSNSRLEIRKKLVEIFGEYSGYAQQYLFFYQRETSRNHKKDG